MAERIGDDSPSRNGHEKARSFRTGLLHCRGRLAANVAPRAVFAERECRPLLPQPSTGSSRDDRPGR